jgi:hypothetical protein
MLSTKRERLTWGATTNEMNLPSQGRVVELLRIAFDDRPACNLWITPSLVTTNRLARIAIPFKDCGMIETGLAHADSKPSSPCKKFHAAHSESALHQGHVTADAESLTNSAI